jgi:hypothetical protein
VSTPIQIVQVGGLINRGKGKYSDQMPRILWNQRKCPEVAETPTESSPIQTGRGGRVLLELAGSRMLRGKKVMSRGVFLLPKFEGEKRNVRVPSLPLPNFEEFSSR